MPPWVPCDAAAREAGTGQRARGIFIHVSSPPLLPSLPACSYGKTGTSFLSSVMTFGFIVITTVYGYIWSHRAITAVFKDVNSHMPSRAGAAGMSLSEREEEDTCVAVTSPRAGPLDRDLEAVALRRHSSGSMHAKVHQAIGGGGGVGLACGDSPSGPAGMVTWQAAINGAKA